MDIIQFIGFLILMGASVVLSIKNKKEKKGSLDRFEELDKETPKTFKEPFEEDEEEDEEDFTVPEEPVPMPQPTQIIVKPEVSQLPQFQRPIIKSQMPPPTVMVAKPEVPPPLPSGPIIPKIDTFKSVNVFDFHKEAFVQKGVEIYKPIDVLAKLESLQEAIIIQNIFNKPKGW